MTAQETLEEGVIAFLIYQRASLLERLRPGLEQKQELLKTEDPSFHDEIESQFETLARREIAEEIAAQLNFDPEQVFLIVESMNIKEFIDG